MHRILSLILLLFVSTLGGLAQSVIISGRVTSQSQEPVSFANIYAKGSTVRVSTDQNGMYKLRLKRVPDYIGVNCLGYQNMTKKTGRGRQQVIDFVLLKYDSTIHEKTFMKKNESSALDIIRRIIAHKPSHNKDKMNAYGYEAYTKIQLELVDVNERFQKRKFFKPFKFVFSNIDSSSENKPFLPFFISETVSDFYFQKIPLAGREIIKAAKISGVSDVSVSQFLGTSFAESNIYDDYITIMKRDFLSPIATGGINSYYYFLEDSQVIDGYKCYRVRFAPRSPQLLRLEGELWVTASSYAVKQIRLLVRSNKNVNLINTLSLYQEYTPVKDSIWMLRTENLEVDFIKFNNKPELLLRKNAFYRNFQINPNHTGIDSLFKNGRPDVSVRDSAHLRSDTYWKGVRNAAASTGSEDRVYKMIDTMSSLKATKNYINLIQTVTVGFVDAGPISLGNVYTLVGRNDIQGWTFKLALRTNAKLSKVVRVGGFAGYGLHDKKLRYGAEALWLIKKNPRISFLGSYRYDIMPNPNTSTFFSTPEFFTTYGLRRLENDSTIPLKLLDNHELKFQFYHEFKYGYSYEVGFKNQKLTPLQNFTFSYHTSSDNIDPNIDISTVTATEFSLTQRFAWKERYVGYNFSRISLGSNFPVVYLQYALGVKRIIGSQFSYHKLAAGISDSRLIGPLGKLKYSIEGGKIFGTLPYLLLYTPDVSETYITWWPSFNTLQKYQLVGDRYLKVMIDHHLEGLIFDRIPGFNKLKWREVWSAKMWWGDMTAANYTANYASMADNAANKGEVKIQNAGKVPFIEMSAGIENILSIFRIDAVWRATHLDPLGTRFSFRHGNFGVRLGLELQF